MDNERRRELQNLLWGAGRWAVYTLLAVGALWAVGSVLFGLGHRKPQTVNGVLSGAASKSDGGSYVVEYQALRRVAADGDELTTGVHANVQVDTASGAYVMDMAGLTSDGKPLHIQHARNLTIYTTPSFGDAWIEAPNLSDQAVDGFTPKAMLSMKPELLRDTGQYRSAQSWVVRIKPTGDQLAKLLWGNELNLTGSSAATEAKALHDGNYTLTWGYVWVAYQSERLLAVDLKFKIDHGAEYRIRMKYGEWGAIDLKSLVFRKTGIAQVTPSIASSADATGAAATNPAASDPSLTTAGG